MSGGSVALSLWRRISAPSVQRCRDAARILFGRYLLVTNVGLSAGFSFTGDLIVQQYERSQGRKMQIDAVRSSQVTVSGAVVSPRVASLITSSNLALFSGFR